ncbi:NAD-binding protein [Chloroflexi bacterium TSY]|nr:NAD-binding protein [Chloroflexi bacterium TSY]
MSQSVSPMIGFVGLGAMGMGMVRSLLEAGLPVCGYDIRPSALETLQAAGGLAATTVVEAATNVDVFILMVVNAEQVETVLFGKSSDSSGGAVSVLKPDSTVMLCSTVKPAYASELATRLEDHSLNMLDAPVSGGPLRAADGTLSVMASGKPSVFDKVAVILDAIAADVHRMGDECGLGSTMKMINQLLAGVHIVTAAEAMAFGAKAGVDPHKIYDVISTSAGSSWMFQNRMPHVLEDDYTPLSAVNIWVKDLGIVLETGKDRFVNRLKKSFRILQPFWKKQVLHGNMPSKLLFSWKIWTTFPF